MYWLPITARKRFDDVDIERRKVVVEKVLTSETRQKEVSLNLKSKNSVKFPPKKQKV